MNQREIPRELRERVAGAIISVAERNFRSITPEERERFFEGLTDEYGEPIVFGNDDCGLRQLQIFNRPDVYLLRLGIPAGAATNGCIEKGKRWLNETAEELEFVAACFGRKWLPFVLVITKLGPDGRPVEFIDKRVLTRGRGD